MPAQGKKFRAAVADVTKQHEATKNVDNVISSETQPAKVQQGSMGMDAGLFGATALGAPANASGGVMLGLVYRAERFAVAGTGRAGRPRRRRGCRRSSRAP